MYIHIFRFDITKYATKFSLHLLEFLISSFFTCKSQPKLQDKPLNMTLPIYVSTTYNLKGSILTLPKVLDSHEMNSLLKVADVWLNSLKVEVHHDYNHFVKDGK